MTANARIIIQTAAERRADSESGAALPADDRHVYRPRPDAAGRWPGPGARGWPGRRSRRRSAAAAARRAGAAAGQGQRRQGGGTPRRGAASAAGWPGSARQGGQAAAGAARPAAGATGGRGRQAHGGAGRRPRPGRRRRPGSARGGRGGSFANMTPEERQQMMASGGEAAARRRSGGGRGRGQQPSNANVAPIALDAEKIDDLYPPCRASHQNGQVWTWDEANKKLTEIRVVTGPQRRPVQPAGLRRREGWTGIVTQHRAPAHGGAARSSSRASSAASRAAAASVARSQAAAAGGGQQGGGGGGLGGGGGGGGRGGVLAVDRRSGTAARPGRADSTGLASTRQVHRKNGVHPCQ